VKGEKKREQPEERSSVRQWKSGPLKGFEWRRVVGGTSRFVFSPRAKPLGGLSELLRKLKLLIVGCPVRLGSGKEELVGEVLNTKKIKGWIVDFY
jgi:hypothetical protein